MTENYWLKKLEKTYAHQSGLVTGIGDDAAAWQPDPDELILLSADMLIGGVHFDLNTHSPELIGRKALAVNLSDMAAMGGVPKVFTVSVGIPKGFAPTDLNRLYQGMDDLAKEFDVALAGEAHPVSQRSEVLGKAFCFLSTGRVIPRTPVAQRILTGEEFGSAGLTHG